MRAKGFTLIELLVVIAIISILAGLLFPVFAEAKATAKQTVCIVHTHEIGLAMMMYRMDYDDMWPPAVITAPMAGFSDQQMWIGYDNNNGPNIGGLTGFVNQPAINRPRPGAIDPYLRSERIKACPSQPKQYQLAIAYNWFHPGFESPYYDRNPAARDKEYGPGSRSIFVDALGLVNDVAINDSEMEDRSNTLVTWEHDARVPLCNFLQGIDWFENPPTESKSLRDHFNFLHRDRSTTLWGDGHAKSVTFAQLKRPMFSVRKDIY
ncbi:MAG TPA: type II secretion system protein [Fimbriimonadaceae bacterium]|nr:type II secretion system protein [Fimbriimonadaceae bacterium]